MIDKSLRQYYQNGKEVDPYRKGLEIIAGKGKDTIQTTAPGKITARNLIKLAKKMTLPSVRKDKIVPSIKTLPKTARPSFDQKKYSGLASAFYDKIKAGEESYLDKYINRDPVRTAGGVEEWGEDYDYLTSSAAPDTALAAAPQTDTALTAAPDKLLAQLVTSPQTDTAITFTGEGETAPSYTDTQIQEIIKSGGQETENFITDFTNKTTGLIKDNPYITDIIKSGTTSFAQTKAANFVAKELGLGAIAGPIGMLLGWAVGKAVNYFKGDKKEEKGGIWTHLVDNKSKDGDDGKEDIDVKDYGFDDSGDFIGEGLTLDEWEELSAPPAPAHVDEPSWSGDSGDSGSTDDGGWGDMSHMIARGGLAQRAPRKSLRQYYQDGKKVDPFRKGIELIAGIEQFLPSKSGKFPGAVSQTPGRTTIKPYASPARPHGTQTERLETLLKDDPALGLYNLANLKGYTSITDPTERAKALKNFGYFEPDTGISYVENLEKLGTGDKTLDKQLAATIGHEQTHALFEDQRFKDIITNMNLSKPRSAYGKGWFDETGYFHEGVKAPSYEPEELLTRLLDVQRYGEAANSDWYFGESPYAISFASIRRIWSRRIKENFSS